MKNKLYFFVLSVNTALGSAVVQASEGYIGVQYANIGYEEKEYPEAKLAMPVARFGAKVSEYLTFEGRFGFGMGMSKDTVYISDWGNIIEVELTLKNLYGVYALGRLPLSRAVSFYVLAGTSKAERTVYDSRFSKTDSGPSFGVGIDLNISETESLNLEYTNYLSDHDYELTALSFGLVAKF